MLSRYANVPKVFSAVNCSFPAFARQPRKPETFLPRLGTGWRGCVDCRSQSNYRLRASKDLGLLQLQQLLPALTKQEIWVFAAVTVEGTFASAQSACFEFCEGVVHTDSTQIQFRSSPADSPFSWKAGRGHVYLDAWRELCPGWQHRQGPRVHEGTSGIKDTGCRALKHSFGQAFCCSKIFLHA